MSNFNPTMTTEIKAKSSTVLDSFEDDEKSDTPIFYAPPMRLTTKELNQILGAVPFVVQIKGEKK